jgi:hypothetical protein
MTTQPVPQAAAPRPASPAAGPEAGALLTRICERLAAQPLTRTLELPATHGRVSALLATYNRCPFDPATALLDNPLAWALETLLGQAGQALREIVVVDDGSTDHTSTVLAHYQQRTSRRLGGVSLVVVRHDHHQGAAAARNAAINAAGGDLLLFGDDDCVFGPHYAAGAAYAFAAVRERDLNACALTLPFYYRALRPREVVPIGEIGRLEPDTARFSTRFHCLPAEYLPTPPVLDRHSGLLAPFGVQLVNGTCLIEAHMLREVGGFADLSAWRTSYSDHLTLAAALIRAGGTLYHCPDPRLGAPHLKWGARGRFPLAPEDLAGEVAGLGRPFGELVTLAATPRQDTGCRTSAATFFPEMLGSFFAFFATHSNAGQGAAAWAQRTYEEFVRQGIVHSLSIDTVPPAPQRRRHWREGVRCGARFAADHPPRVPAGRLQRLLDQVTTAVGEPRISL